MEKQCFKCEKTLPLEDFYKHGDMADGHLNKCKFCTRRDVKSNRRSIPEHYRAYDSRRAMLEHRVAGRDRYRKANPDVVRRSQREWQERNPHKREAHIIVGNALRDEKITRPACCEICQRVAATQAHHEDYSAPLWLAWLCTRCHRLVHNGTVAFGRFHNQRKAA